MSKQVSLFFISFFLLFFGSVKAQTQNSEKDLRVDSIAVYILDRMSQCMQNLSSCSFTTTTDYDVWVDDLGYIKHSDVSKISMVFPNKLRVHTVGDKGNHYAWYDGNSFTYYNLKNNLYSQFKMKGNILQMVDTINNGFGIEFPAADFFYPSFVKDLLDTGGNLVYLGATNLGGEMCFHIVGNDANGTVFQFWIGENEYFLPRKMVITYKEDSGNSQYEAIYTDWMINSVIPEFVFNFEAPPGASKVKFQPTSTKQ